jgi:hypothetical protein
MWVHKTCLTKQSAILYLCVVGQIVPLSTIFVFDFRTIRTVRYFSRYIFLWKLLGEGPMSCILIFSLSQKVWERRAIIKDLDAILHGFMLQIITPGSAYLADFLPAQSDGPTNFKKSALLSLESNKTTAQI